jgi:hypothetical protein
MKIAVFGDSFAARWPQETPVNPGWVTILKNRGFDIDNYGISASSLYYSWKKFKSCDLTDYDRVIFVVTTYGRLSILKKDSKYLHVSGIDHLNRVYDYPDTDDSDRRMLTALRNFWLYINVDEEQKDMQQLMISDILTTCPDVLLISAFPSSRSCVPSLLHGNFKSLTELGAVYDDDTINHLPLTLRQQLADSVETWISTGYFVLE